MIAKSKLAMLVLLPALAFAQKRVVGTVVDAETNEGLPAANVRVVGTMNGATTNEDGRFELFLPRVPASLAVRYLGYESDTLRIRAQTPEAVTIRLEPATYALGGLEVSGEDPAVALMRLVIAKKRAMYGRISSFRAEAFSRFTLYRRGQLVHLREQISETYWRPGGGAREVVLTERRQPARAQAFRFAGPMPVVNLYDDEVDIRGIRFVGPTAPDALDAYTFRLGPERVLDGRPAVDVYASPRDPLRSALAGRLVVLTDSLVVAEAQLRPTWFATLPPPILDWSERFVQQFEPSPEGVWLPVNLRREGFVEFGRAGVNYPRAQFEQVSRLALHVPDQPGPDSLFAGAQRRFVLPFGERRQYLFRGSPSGLVPLSARETEALEQMPASMSLRRAFFPTGFLTQYVQVRLEETPQDQGAPPGRRSFGPFERVLAWYNRVDGVHLGLRQTLRPVDRTELDIGAGVAGLVGSDDVERRPTLRAEGRYRLGSVTFRAGGFDDAVPAYASAVYARSANTIPTYLGLADYFDYVRRQRLYVGAEARTGLFTLEAQLVTDEDRSISRGTTYEGWWITDGQRENPPVDEGQFTTARTTASLGWAGSQFSLSWTRDLTSGRFDQLDAEFRLSAPTFFRRRPDPQRADLWLRAGTSRGNLPTQRIRAVDGSIGAYTSFGGLRSKRGLPYTGNRYAGLFWRYDFGTVPFERMGLYSLSARSLRLALGGGHVWTDGGRASPTSGHHELTLSAGNLFGYPLWLHLTRRLDTPATLVGFSIRN
ncbi:MAG: carboxypeptidase-like regulatory domain-containing protein [Bacteroidota bacterium]